MNIYEFSDVTAFLRAKTGWEGMPKDRPMSAREWAEKLGYKSAQSVSMVLTGERLPSRDMILRLGRELGLNHEEMRYFELLVDLKALRKRGKDPSVVLGELVAINPEFLENMPLDEATYKFVSVWYATVVKQLAGTPDFVADPQAIQERLRHKVTLHDIENILLILKTLDLLVEVDGQLRPGRDMKMLKDVPNDAIKLFHRQMLARATEAIAEQTTQERELIAMTLQMDRSRAAEAKAEIRKFVQSFNEKFFSKEANDVCQLNVQWFSHTK